MFPHIKNAVPVLTINSYRDIDLIGWEPGQVNLVRQQVVIGDYRASIQAGSLFSTGSTPNTDGHPLTKYSSVEFAAWDSSGRPFDPYNKGGVFSLIECGDYQYTISNELTVLRNISQQNLTALIGMLVVTASAISKQSFVKMKQDDLNCMSCKTPAPYAESNQPGGKFKCYLCTATPFYK